MYFNIGDETFIDNQATVQEVSPIPDSNDKIPNQKNNGPLEEQSRDLKPFASLKYYPDSVINIFKKNQHQWISIC
jgi:hypothetical protein